MNKFLSIKKILFLFFFAGIFVCAFIYGRKWVGKLGVVNSVTTANEENIEWQEDAWKEYQQLAIKYQQPVWISGTLSVIDSAAGITQAIPTSFKWGIQQHAFYYQLAQWEVVQKDSMLLLVDNIDKNMILQMLPSDKKNHNSLPALPNLLSIPVSMVKAISGKAEPNQLKSITLLLKDTEIEKIQLYYNPSTGYVTEANIWQISFAGIADPSIPADSLQAKGIEQAELAWQGGDTSAENSSIQAWLGKKLTRINYNLPQPIEKSFSPLEKFINIRDGKPSPAAPYTNYQFAIK